MPRFARPPLRLLAALTLTAAGCGGAAESPAPRPPVYPVRGVVRVKGAPAPGARVVLHPADKSAPHWADGFPRATAGPDGAFAVCTFAADDGAPAGEYVVLVRWPTDTPDPEKATDRLGGRYFDPARPVLKATVAPAPTDLPPFNLR